MLGDIFYLFFSQQSYFALARVVRYSDRQGYSSGKKLTRLTPVSRIFDVRAE